ncbi:MAG: hypothetical protein K2P51_08120 [Rhabdochlamydiaceae bacterium]|nr:hypothetical protein [Rhabdochlamydiaceae bacterium]
MAVFLRSPLYACQRFFSSTPVPLPTDKNESSLPVQGQGTKADENERLKQRVDCILKNIDAKLGRISSDFRKAIDSDCWELVELIEMSPSLRDMLPPKLAKYVDNFSENQTKATTEFYSLRFDLNEAESGDD